MKVSSRIVVAAALLGVLSTQLTTPAICSMALGFSAAHCTMPCCQGHMPAPMKCPQLRAADHPEALLPSNHVLSQSLKQVVAWASAVAAQAPLQAVSSLQHFTQSCATLLIGMRPISRAPPLDSILFSA